MNRGIIIASIYRTIRWASNRERWPATFLEPAAQEAEAANDAPAGERCVSVSVSEHVGCSVSSSCHCPENMKIVGVARRPIALLTPRVGNPYYSAIEQGEVDLPVESKISVLTPKPRKFSIRSKSEFELSGGFRNPV